MSSLVFWRKATLGATAALAMMCGPFPGSPLSYVSADGPVTWAVLSIRSDPPGAHAYDGAGQYLGMTTTKGDFEQDGTRGHYWTYYCGGDRSREPRAEVVMKKRGYKTATQTYPVTCKYNSRYDASLHPEDFIQVLVVLEPE